MKKQKALIGLMERKTILNGGSYLPQFIALAVVGIVLYTVGMHIFVEKDLPL